MRGKNQGIQLLRVLSCLAVFVCHFTQRISMFIPLTVTEFFQLGKYGVELFFVISGYLVCYSVSKEHFYKKRLIRILPLYFFSILVFFLMETFFFHDLPTDSYRLGWLRYIFCLNGILPFENYYWSNIGITWTIPIFLYFYVLAPFLCKIMKSKKSSVIAILVMMVGLLFLNHFIPGWFSAFYYIPCFMLGILAFHITEDKSKSFFTILMIVLYMAIHFFEKKYPFLEVYSVSCLFMIMVLYSNAITFKNHKILDILDEYSYTIYLVHGMVLCLCIDKFKFSLLVRIFIMIVGTYDFSYLIHEYYEKPVQGLLNPKK